MTESHRNVDIVATLLTDKPPSLPLRQEYPSLGFEVVHRAAGVGQQAARATARARARQVAVQTYSDDVRTWWRPSKKRALRQAVQRHDEWESLAQATSALSYDEYDQFRRVTSGEDDFTLDYSSDSELQKRSSGDDDNGMGLQETKRRWRQLRKRHERLDDEKELFPSDLLHLSPVSTMETAPLDPPAELSLPTLAHEEAPPDPEAWNASNPFLVPMTVSSDSEQEAPTSTWQSVMNRMVSAASPEFLTAMDQAETTAEEDSSRPFLTLPMGNSNDDNDENVLHRPVVSTNPFDTIVQSFSGDEVFRSQAAASPLESIVKSLSGDELLCRDPGASSPLANLPLSPPASPTWLDSAKQALDQITLAILPDSPKAAQPVTVETLFQVLGESSATTSQVASLLQKHPEFLQVRSQSNGRLPLHALCARPLSDCYDATSALQNMRDYALTMQLVYDLHPNACVIQDHRGDLPAHLLARTLLQWEAVWYESVYQSPDLDTITALYQKMSETVQRVLTPLTVTLCHLPGSQGVLLPLHMATIFTCAVPCLRRLLELYPGAASIPVNVQALKTFCPTNVTALELHDLLSTDFPKWENEQETSVGKWSGSGPSPQHAHDCIRRSDLLFAYHPIPPFRLEKNRIRRLEARLVHEAKQDEWSPSSARVWWWMTTFQDDQGTATYVNSVKRIVQQLPLSSVRTLVNQKNARNATVLEAASPTCAKILQRRMDELASNIVPIASQGSSGLMQSWDETQASRLSITDRGLVSHCSRLLFGIPADSVPIAFCILPYPLLLGADGVPGIASPSEAKLAMQFAEVLLELTSATSILHYLHIKSVRYYDESLYAGNSPDVQRARLAAVENAQEVEGRLLSLYKGGSGYFYLIDEVTGTPVIPAKGEQSCYPMVLADAASIVRKALPLMLFGMLQLRGEKAVPILQSILLDANVGTVPPQWMDAAKEIGAYLYSQQAKETEQASSPSTDELVAFLANSKDKIRKCDRPKNGTTEWNVEMSILKMLLDMHDPEKTYTGLKATQESKDVTIWTLPEPDSQASKSSSSRSSTNMAALIVDGGRNPSRGSFGLGLPPRPKTKSRQSGPVDLDDSVATGDESSVQTSPEDNKSPRRPSLRPFFSKSASQDNEPIRIIKSKYSDDVTEPSHSSMLMRYETVLPLDSDNALTIRCADTDEASEEETMMERFDFLEYSLAINQPVRKVRFAEEPDSLPNLQRWDYGKRVWIETTSSLIRSPVLCHSFPIVQMKACLAAQGKQLSLMSHESKSLRDEFYFQTDPSCLSPIEWDAHGLNRAGPTRELLLRLRSIEDSVLFNEVELQHVSLNLFSLMEDVNNLENGLISRYCPRSKFVLPKRFASQAVATGEDKSTEFEVDKLQDTDEEEVHTDDYDSKSAASYSDSSGSEINDIITALRSHSIVDDESSTDLVDRCRMREEAKSESTLPGNDYSVSAPPSSIVFDEQDAGWETDSNRIEI